MRVLLYENHFNLALVYEYKIGGYTLQPEIFGGGSCIIEWGVYT